MLLSSMRKIQYIQPEVMIIDCEPDRLILAGSVTTVDSGDAELIIDDSELETGRSREDYFFW